MYGVCRLSVSKERPICPGEPGGGAEQEGETVICERPVDTGSRTKVNKKKKLGNAALRGKGLLCDGLSALSLH